MPNRNKIINLDAARRKQQGETPPLHELLSWLDELEEAAETLDKAGIETREQLEELIRTLEAQISTGDDE
jgi:mannitol/fructose-specific phosphotransferase system IIA component (Ntr-type)